MFRYSKKIISSYFNELNNVDFNLFNEFIVNKLIANSLKLNTIVPIMLAIAVVAFSFSLQDSFYIFIPQSSITSFASFLLFACVASLLLLILYPLLIIMILNYIAYKLRNKLKTAFLPLKLIILVLGFYICVVILTGSSNFTVSQRLNIAGLWLLLYFTLINLYISYSHNSGKVKLTKFRVLFGVIFILLLIKPFLVIFLYTSEKINYTSFNPKVYLTKANCNLITTSISAKDNLKNMSINNPMFYRTDANGCYLSGNLIRYGFGSDFVLIFKKNILPIKANDNKSYNAYMRLNCYSSNCYADDDFFVLNDKDEINMLLQSDLERRQKNRNNLQQNKIF